jgi:hypothetical protein
MRAIVLTLYVVVALTTASKQYTSLLFQRLSGTSDYIPVVKQRHNRELPASVQSWHIMKSNMKGTRVAGVRLGYALVMTRSEIDRGRSRRIFMV